MSDTNIKPTDPPSSAGLQADQSEPVATEPAPRPTPPPAPLARSDQALTGWVGWIAFAAIMAILVGVFHMFQGLVALLSQGYYLVAESGLTIHVDYTGWGWVHIILGAVLIVAGIGLITGRMWARVLGVGLAALSALVNVAFLAASPVWSTIMVAFDVLVIWALTVHGREMKALDEEGVSPGRLD
jgi:vacuolar-type H+-ATPase subunit I/STV1